MKKLYFAIFFIALTSMLRSQDSEPEALFFLMPGTQTVEQFDIANFKQENFLLTWQWDNHPRMTTALGMNAHQTWAPTWGGVNLNQNDTGEDLDFLWQPKSWPEGNPHMVPTYFAKSFTYKPTFTVEPDNFTQNPSDQEHNIWGFRVRNIENPVVLNNRLQLTESMTYSNPVLSSPWRGDNFYALPVDDPNYDKFDYNGLNYRVTLNLRRSDFSQINDIKDNEPVLTIKIPYYLTPGSSGSNGLIKFNTKPDFNTIDAMEYTYTVNGTDYTIDRGNSLGMTNAISDSIVITRNMIPNLADTLAGIGPDITITFTFKAALPLNPVFKSVPNGTTPNTIDSIGLDVYYRGNCGILLNYIRIGNPLSDMMWKGELDVEYQDLLQKGIKIIHENNFRIFRFYGRDEIGGGLRSTLSLSKCTFYGHLIST